MVHVTELQAIFVHARVAAPQCTCASLDHLRSAFNRAKRRLEPRCAHICASNSAAVLGTAAAESFQADRAGPSGPSKTVQAA